MCMNMYNNNLNSIKNGFPELYERLATQTYNKDKLENIEIEFERTMNYPSLVITNLATNSRIRMNSSYDPEYAAQVWYRGLNEKEKKGQNLFLVGLGNGSYARSIIVNKTSQSKLFIYESSMDVFLQALRICDLSLFFSTPGVRVIIKGINEDMSSGVLEEMLTINNYDDKAFFVSPNYGRVFPDAAKEIARIYRNGVGIIMSNRNTVRRFIKYSPFNQLYNIRYLEENTVVPYLAESWEKDVPVLLVGAGPSLKDDIHIIKKLRELVYVFAVDSALNFLLQHDIIPDMFISIEPKKDWAYFADDRVRKIPMFAKLATNHELIKKQQAPIVFCYEEELAERIYNKYDIPKSMYRFGGNGATSLFAICKELGVKTVILVGQDMAYGSDHKSHIHEQSEAYEAEECFIVDGNNGNKVQSRQDWYRFAKWYENAIPVCKFDHVINTAKNGVKIQGAEYVPLERAIREWGKKHSAIDDIFLKTKKTFYGKTVNVQEIYRLITKEVCDIIENRSKIMDIKSMLIYGILQLYKMADEDVTEDDFGALAHKLLKYLEECKKDL